MILNQLESPDIENIIIFVCDSLRWDYTPDSILNMGISIKTIASSLYTASSFPSIVSGLYPPKTGVHSWEDVLPRNLRGILEIDGYNSSLWCETTWTNLPPNKSAIHRILGNPKGISLKDIDPPFIFIEDDKGGHCPYGINFGEYMGGGCPDFYKEYGKKGKKELIKQYKIGIQQSVERFKERIEILKERELIKNTLIVFTSDHGELLGEYGGLTGHGRPACPELVYVPTVFIHPSLKAKKIQNKIISHVDIFPTILSILNKRTFYEVDGINLTKDLPSSIGLNFRFGGYLKTKNIIKSWMNYKSSSVWGFYGGHIFHDLGRIKALSMFSFKIFIQKHVEFNFMLENLRNRPSNKYKDYKKALKHLISPHITFMNPRISKDNAEKIILNYMKENIKFNEKEIIKSKIKKLMSEGNL
jgi:hypothetical protein